MFFPSVVQAATECTRPSHNYCPVWIASSATSNDETTPGSEALLLRPSRFFLKVEHLHIHQNKNYLVLIFYRKPVSPVWNKCCKETLWIIMLPMQKYVSLFLFHCCLIVLQSQCSSCWTRWSVYISAGIKSIKCEKKQPTSNLRNQMEAGLKAAKTWKVVHIWTNIWILRRLVDDKNVPANTSLKLEV